MSILNCIRNGQHGKKYNEHGFCFIGDDAEIKANAQGLVIEHNKKGTAGKSTGSSAKAAIQKAIDGGHSLAEIAAVAKRDVDTISQIRSGRIENPPPELVTAIRAMKPKPKAKS